MQISFYFEPLWLGLYLIFGIGIWALMWLNPRFIGETKTSDLIISALVVIPIWWIWLLTLIPPNDES